MNALLLVVSLAALGPGQGPATIDPGMTQAQVVAKLGEPSSTRSYDGHTYLLYKNGCERTCGMSDLVVLDSDKVVDAIFRSRARRYSGTSSSPHMIPAAEARRGPDKGDAEAKPAKAEKAAKPPKAAKPETAEEKMAKIENAGAPPKPAPAAKPAAKMPEVIRPAPAKKPDSSKKVTPPKKPTS